MPPLVYIDGEVYPADRAVVPVFDRGFLYGDGVYEVLRTYDGRPHVLGLHLARLGRSGALIGIDGFPSVESLTRAVHVTLDAADHGDSYVRIIVTRGGGPISLDPAQADEPRVVILVKEVVVPSGRTYAQGIGVSLVGVIRNPRTALDPGAKTGNYLNNILALREARARGADEAIMCNVQGQISEGASSNVFVVRDGRLATPPLHAGILEGITRRLVMDLARREGIGVDEVDLVPSDVAGADEVFITSSIREVMPVTRCDGAPIGAGVPGPVTERLRTAYARAARGDQPPSAN